MGRKAISSVSSKLPKEWVIKPVMEPKTCSFIRDIMANFVNEN